MLGEDHFAYDSHGTTGNIANVLATIDKDALTSFITQVVKIREDLEAEYFFATKALTGDDE